MQICIHLPEELAARFKTMVPARQRSAFVADLLDLALPREEDPLYRIALAVEEDEALAEEMADWEVTAGDGLGGERETR
jgi:hypothetical protein